MKQTKPSRTHTVVVPACTRLRRLALLLLVAGLTSLAALGAAPAFAECVDGDGDGYGLPGDPACPNGAAADCDDDDADRNPGETELCDGFDNDCNDGVDEGFFVGFDCTVSDPAGCMEGDAGGCCFTVGTITCTPDHTATFCQLGAEGQDFQDPEGPAGAPSCFDGEDNDCDGLTDHQEGVCQTSELCNGFDDDNDGVIDDGFAGLGGPCTAGVGECAAGGLTVCSDDESGTVCTAVPKNPKSEATPGAGRCVDGLDNDCDGTTDLADSSCQEGESCDGVDNDGDGSVDEDFTTLGDACAAGIGACAAAGTVVCAADGDSAICDAVAGIPATEGPVGPTCSDGIDNDCDGTSDLADPGCGSAGLAVTCSLPYTKGQPGGDCNGKHRLTWNVSGAGADTVVTAELLALSGEGGILATLPVGNGEVAHLASRIGPAEFKAVTRTNKGVKSHEVFAPVPLLRVTAQDGLNKAQAFCSNVPYLQVIEPANTVTTEAQGNSTRVLAAVPQVDPATLFIKVDGVDIVSALGLDPATAFPGGPYSGNVTIHGENVAIDDLTVGSGAIAEPASNSVSFTMTGLGCGGHITVVDGAPRAGALQDPTTTQCHIDDVRGRANSMTFAIDITGPAPGEVTSAVPTPVTGEICHGLAIASASINGLPLATGGATLIPGDGEDSADTYKLAIDTTLDRTDIAQDLATGDEPLGTFDAGSNRLVAEATDENGTRVFASLIFATGSVASPALGTLSQGIRAAFEDELRGMIADEIMRPLDGTPVVIENAFVVGLTAEALQKVFSGKCVEAATSFVNEVRNQIPIGKIVDQRSVSGGCSCSPTVTTRVASISIDPNAISCPVVLVDGKANVEIHLPDIVVGLTSSGYCKTSARVCVPFTDICTPGVCLAETVVNDSFTATISGLAVKFDMTEEQLEKTAPPNPPTRGVCSNDSSPCGFDSDCSGGATCTIGTVNTVGEVTAEVNCLASACNWVLNGLIAITNAIFQTNLQPVLVDFTFSPNFTREIGASEPDPIELEEIKVDEEQVAEFDLLMQGTLANVEITPSGLTASLTGEFATAAIDPSVPSNPGAVVDEAPAPALPVAGTGDAFIVMADDAFNQLFASIVASGNLQTGCVPTDKTVGDLLPADCDTLTGSIARGLCHGIRQADCELLSMPTQLGTAIEQGTCHGARNANCAMIPVAETTFLENSERGACEAPLARRNLQAANPLLFCTQQQMPPRLFILDQPATPAVETALRLNDLSLVMLVDRDGDGLDGALASTALCLSATAATVGDCNLYSVCLDLNFDTSMQFATCADGKPGLTTSFVDVQALVRQAGVMCGGGTASADGQVTNAGATDQTIDLLGDDVEAFTPPICANGLTLGGFVSLQNLKLISIETDSDDETDDYLGITGDVAP